jgi:hypothetical protein
VADGTYLPLARDTQWRARAHSPRRGLRAPGLGQYHASDASDYWQAPARAVEPPAGQACAAAARIMVDEAAEGGRLAAAER